MTEPMKCANGCGDYVWEMMPLEVVHIKHEDGKPAWRVGVTSCGKVLVATLPPTGIKSEPERPPIPTSRDWLEEDGQYGLDEECGAVGYGNRRRLSYICSRDNHDYTDWHVAGVGDNQVAGRWYTDGPFAETK